MTLQIPPQSRRPFQSIAGQFPALEFPWVSNLDRRHAEWTPERFRRWGTSIGPQTEGLIIPILASRPHPEQGFKTCLEILHLYRDIGHDRAEAVSARCRDRWLEQQDQRLTHCHSKEKTFHLTCRRYGTRQLARSRSLSLRRNPIMLTNPTINVLLDLGLSSMESAYQELDRQQEVRHLDHGEWLALLLERETNSHRRKRFEKPKVQATVLPGMVSNLQMIRARVSNRPNVSFWNITL